MLSLKLQEILVGVTGLFFLLILTRAFFLNRILSAIASALLKMGHVKLAMRFKGWGDPAFKRKQRCHK